MRKKTEMIVRFRRLLERDAEQGVETARKSLGKNRVAFNDAGIAEGRALTRTGAIDQRDGEPALDEVQRDRRADNAGTQHQRIRASHALPSAEALTLVAIPGLQRITS